MATAVLPQKRVFGEASSARRNIPSSPSSAKKRKLEPFSSPAARFKSSQNGPKGKLGSSQPKSQFESEVLEKLTSDMSGLKKNNSEKDQQWDRPALADFNAKTDTLCFQQIEAEEGTLHGGKATVKLFGVTEVVSLFLMPSDFMYLLIIPRHRPATQSCYMSQTSFIISMLRLPFPLFQKTAKASRHSSRPRSHNISQPYTLCR
jgi:DNA polymerase delta subunit 1